MLAEFYRRVVAWLGGLPKRYQQAVERDNSRRHRVKLVESRLTRLLVDAKLGGLDDYELAKLVVPNLADVLRRQQEKRKPTTKAINKRQVVFGLIFGVFIFTFGLVAIFRHCRPCSRLGLKYTRRALFAIEPYWHWQNVYATRCLIPRYSSTTAKPPPPMTRKVVCDYCEDLNNITYVDDAEGIDLDRVTAFHVANKIPLVFRNHSKLQDDIRTWTLFTNFTDVQSLHKIYDVDTVGRFCMFRSNLVDVDDPWTLLSEVSSSSSSSINPLWNLTWYAHWENCKLHQKKSLRRHYHRPLVLPPTTELTQASWLLISSGVDPFRTYKPIAPPGGVDLAVVVQVHGSIDIQLHPSESSCHGRCARHQLRLSQFQVLVISVTHWLLDYRPVPIDRNNNDTSINLSVVLTGVHV